MATRETSAPGVEAVLRKAMRLQSAEYTRDDNATVAAYVNEILEACGMPDPVALAAKKEAEKEAEAKAKEAEKATAGKKGMY